MRVQRHDALGVRLPPAGHGAQVRVLRPSLLPGQGARSFSKLVLLLVLVPLLLPSFRLSPSGFHVPPSASPPSALHLQLSFHVYLVCSLHPSDCSTLEVSLNVALLVHVAADDYDNYNDDDDDADVPSETRTVSVEYVIDYRYTSSGFLSALISIEFCTRV